MDLISSIRPSFPPSTDHLPHQGHTGYLTWLFWISSSPKQAGSPPKVPFLPGTTPPASQEPLSRLPRRPLISRGHLICGQQIKRRSKKTGHSQKHNHPNMYPNPISWSKPARATSSQRFIAKSKTAILLVGLPRRSHGPRRLRKQPRPLRLVVHLIHATHLRQLTPMGQPAALRAH